MLHHIIDGALALVFSVTIEMLTTTVVSAVHRTPRTARRPRTWVYSSTVLVLTAAACLVAWTWQMGLLLSAAGLFTGVFFTKLFIARHRAVHTTAVAR